MFKVPWDVEGYAFKDVRLDFGCSLEYGLVGQVSKWGFWSRFENAPATLLSRPEGTSAMVHASASERPKPEVRLVFMRSVMHREPQALRPRNLQRPVPRTLRVQGPK